MRLRIVLALVAFACAGMALGACRVEIGDGPAGEFKPETPGVLTVATEKVPSAGFWLGTAEDPTGGFEYGLAEALADRFGLDRIEIRTVPFERMIEGDLAGADIGLRELTPTGERERNLDFSIPYISAPPAALVRAGEEIPDLKTARELSWAVPRGTTLVDTLERTVRPDETTVAADRESTVEAVRKGEADAAFFDLPVALALARDSAGELEVAAQFNGDEALSAALPKGTSNLEAVNAAIRRLAADGTISDLAEEWLGTRLQSSSFTVPDIPLIR